MPNRKPVDSLASDVTFRRATAIPSRKPLRPGPISVAGARSPRMTSGCATNHHRSQRRGGRVAHAARPDDRHRDGLRAEELAVHLIRVGLRDKGSGSGPRPGGTLLRLTGQRDGQDRVTLHPGASTITAATAATTAGGMARRSFRLNWIEAPVGETGGQATGLEAGRFARCRSPPPPAGRSRTHRRRRSVTYSPPEGDACVRDRSLYVDLA
jgi:hypothetical protein